MKPELSLFIFINFTCKASCLDLILNQKDVIKRGLIGKTGGLSHHNTVNWTEIVMTF